MTLRAYQQSDKEACLELFRSNTPKFFAASEEADFVAHLKDANNHHGYFVLEKEGNIVGCGGYALENTRGYLTWGMVDHSQHGIGAGKRLLLERLKLITEHSEVKDIVLDTSQHTFGFFRKLGFVTTKITEHGYGEHLHRYDIKLSLEKSSRQRINTLLLAARAKNLTHGVVND
jgi:N-acetylglutamate synthase-like GNAT family acetyltransferase